MSFRTTPTGLGRAKQFARLGLQGDRLPAFDTEKSSGVYIMGQLGSLGAEPLEARAVGGEITGAGLGFAGFELQAVGGGGAVIESIEAETGGAGNQLNLYRSPASLLSGKSQVNALSVGGRDVQGILREGSVNGSPPPNEAQVQGSATSILGRIFVPAGWFFTVVSNNAGLTLEWQVQWREIEDTPGAP